LNQAASPKGQGITLSLMQDANGMESRRPRAASHLDLFRLRRQHARERPACPAVRRGETDAEVARGSWRLEARAVRRAARGEPSCGASGGRGDGQSLRRRRPERPRPLPPAERPLHRPLRPLRAGAGPLSDYQMRPIGGWPESTVGMGCSACVDVADARVALKWQADLPPAAAGVDARPKKSIALEEERYADANDPHRRDPCGWRPVRVARPPGPRPGEAHDRADISARDPDRAAVARLPLPGERRTDVSGLRPGAVPATGPGAQGRAQHRPHPDRRRRLRPVQHVRRPRALAHDGQARRRRAALQHLPHDRAVQSDARRAHHRTQPPLGRVRRHPGGRYGLRRLYRHHPVAVRARSPRSCARTGT
jgi:hypothetical protein